ncbi:MAG: hypothetical protein K9M55_01630 [Candidatus Marinimicrobia bacterium]|nr:hypothetical protein [Candidatus Neomarinimicrobiota bacterium]MCF7921379.1 hypothetical protein [Candidatus Neomarinimicrobiota bacterium]
MDLDNLGPIVLFIIYMAISAWSKQNKARQKAMPKENPKLRPSPPVSKPMQEVGGILSQLKKELFEIDEEPLVFQQAMPEYEEEVEIPEFEPEPKPQFVEGSVKTKPIRPLERVTLDYSLSAGQSLDELLEPFSRLEQGIILHEILGKPRARQRNDEWFHRS